MGADVICIKDMANLLLPYDAYSLVKQAEGERVDVPIHLHTHNTTGTGDMVYLMAIAGGRGHCGHARFRRWRTARRSPATESLVATLRRAPTATPGIDLNEADQSGSVISAAWPKSLKAEGLLDSEGAATWTSTRCCIRCRAACCPT